MIGQCDTLLPLGPVGDLAANVNCDDVDLGEGACYRQIPFTDA
jgi:hypothetical protein